MRNRFEVVPIEANDKYAIYDNGDYLHAYNSHPGFILGRDTDTSVTFESIDDATAIAELLNDLDGERG